jgi:hypothetical protein
MHTLSETHTHSKTHSLTLAPTCHLFSMDVQHLKSALQLPA